MYIPFYFHEALKKLRSHEFHLQPDQNIDVVTFEVSYRFAKNKILNVHVKKEKRAPGLDQ